MSDLPDSLWSNCERCGELEPADSLVERAGAGWVCAGCDPGPTLAIFGEVLAEAQDHPGRPHLWAPGLDSCSNCERSDIETFRVLADQNSIDEEWVWYALCFSCLAERWREFCGVQA